NILRNLDYQKIEYYLFNLAIQCLSNQWYEYSIDLLQMQSNRKLIENENVHGKHWKNFFKHLFNNDKSNLIEIFIELMIKKNLIPLDAILRAYYTNSNDDYRLALNYLEQGRIFQHPMRINYFYPLLLNVYSLNTYQNWTDNDRLRLFSLLNHLSIQI